VSVSGSGDGIDLIAAFGDKNLTLSLSLSLAAL
jgi:hypothetical protein